MYVLGKMKRAIFEKYGPIVKEDDFRRAFVTLVSHFLKLKLFILVLCSKKRLPTFRTS